MWLHLKHTDQRWSVFWYSLAVARPNVKYILAKIGKHMEDLVYSVLQPGEYMTAAELSNTANRGEIRLDAFPVCWVHHLLYRVTEQSNLYTTMYLSSCQSEHFVWSVTPESEWRHWERERELILADGASACCLTACDIPFLASHFPQRFYISKQGTVLSYKSLTINYIPSQKSEYL